MPVLRHLLCLLIVLFAAKTAVQAQQAHTLQVDSLTVLRDGRVLVRYDIQNTSDRPVCMPAKDGVPQVFVEQFSATDNLPMLHADRGLTGQERFQSFYLMLGAGQSLSSSVIYSAHDFAGLRLAEGQLADSPRVEEDSLFVILSVPLRNCPLFRHKGELTFNGGWHITRLVRSLPSRVFSLQRLGRY